MSEDDPPTRDGLPIVTPEAAGDEHRDREVDEREESTESGQHVGGVLLAAGTSSRFGDRNKLLETEDGDPIVRRAAQTLCRARIDTIVVVLGYEAERVADALGDLDAEFVHNDAYDTGQASSVRAGIGALCGRVDAAVIALGDMPSVSPTTVDALIERYEAGAGDALAAAYEGRRGNPVLFDARHFEHLAAVDGDVGGRRILLEGDNSALVAVGDPGVRRDVDVPADLVE